MAGVASGIERHGTAFIADHPPADSLVAFVNGELQGDERREVERHLAFCATCTVEVRWISGDEIAGRVAPSHPSASRWNRAWVVAAALAAAFALGLFVPTLFDGGAVSPSFPRLRLVAQPELAGARPTRIEVKREELRFSALVPVDLAPAEFPSTVEISNREGRIVGRTTIAGPEELVAGRYLAFECPLTDCPAGAYTAGIRTRGGTLRESIPFEVVLP